MKFIERGPVQRSPTQLTRLLWAHQEMKQAQDMDSRRTPKDHSAGQRVPVWFRTSHPVGMAGREDAVESTRVPRPLAISVSPQTSYYWYSCSKASSRTMEGQSAQGLIPPPAPSSPHGVSSVSVLGARSPRPFWWASPPGPGQLLYGTELCRPLWWVVEWHTPCRLPSLLFHFPLPSQGSQNFPN